jgi:hypothetical protein
MVKVRRCTEMREAPPAESARSCHPCDIRARRQGATTEHTACMRSGISVGREEHSLIGCRCTYTIGCYRSLSPTLRSVPARSLPILSRWRTTIITPATALPTVTAGDTLLAATAATSVAAADIDPTEM